MAKAKPSLSSITEILDALKAPRISVPVVLSADLRAEHAKLVHRYEDAVASDMRQRSGGTLAAPQLAAELLALEKAIEESTTFFEFEALPREAYRRLLADHPPRPEDDTPFNAETFPAALIAACAVDPTMNATQASQLASRSDGLFAKLFGEVVDLNVDDPIAPKSLLLSAVAAANESDSTTASPEGSPAASS